jgi:hypothetical protein
MSSLQARRHTQFRIQWISGDPSPRVMQLGRENHHSPPTSAEVNKKYIHTSIPYTYLLPSA